jgi:glycosyltransferase involved in cell wall biosynthesis
MKEFITKTGEKILYQGNPNLEILEKLSSEAGDIWHSSANQGFKNCFPELMYQSPLFWFINDFDGLEQSVNWRINPNAFAIRVAVWEKIGGFDQDFSTQNMAALDFGYRAVRYLGAVSLFVEKLFQDSDFQKIEISKKERYLFFIKNFKIQHSLFMLYRKGFWNVLEWITFFKIVFKYKKRTHNEFIEPRQLKPLESRPSVSYIIPTMMRQSFTKQLLDDLKTQTLLPTQVVIVDATPKNQRDLSIYDFSAYPFQVILKWQTTKGSCRARNEAIDLCTGDYIIFGDDDIRIFPNFIENHIRFLQTNKADACNGIDIQADHLQQNLTDLERKFKAMTPDRLIAGVAQSFSNANSCVKTEFVKKLIGNDINFDGGYGEDSDFGLSLLKLGVTVLYNPFSPNLHLKPLTGGYRFWGSQAKVIGKKRKTQPWELNVPVKKIRPVPSPTVMYGILKQYSPQQLIEYKHKHFFHYLFEGSKIGFLYRFLRIPYKNLEFKKSFFYAKRLIDLGIRTK